MGISLTGLASGLDTAQMVSDLMKIERIPYNNLEAKKTNLRSEQTIFRNINTAFRSLETALNNLKLGPDWKQMSGASSNTSAVGVTTKGNAPAGKYQINVVQLAQKNTLQLKFDHLFDASGNLKSDIKIGNLIVTNSDLSGDINSDPPEDIIKEKMEKLASLIDSKSSEAGVSAATLNIAATGSDFRLILTSKETGDESLITMSAGSIDLTKATDVINNKTNTNTLNAIVQFNGVELQRSTNTIDDDLIKGATLTLTGTGVSTVTVDRDTDAIVKKVQEFVKAYNNLISMVKENLAKPTDDSKMNPLQGDALLKRIDSELYNIFNSGVKNTGDSKASFMEQLGLSIDKGVTSASLMTGKITFDEATFKNALADDPDKVIGVFTNGKPEATETHTTGIITQLSEIINNYASSASGLITNKITGYDSEIKFVDDRMERMSLRLEMHEMRLKQQFSTMETMLSTLQSEQKWLTQQFESLVKSNSK